MSSGLGKPSVCFNLLLGFILVSRGVTVEVENEEYPHLKSNFVSVSYNNQRQKELRIGFRGNLVLETIAFENTQYEIHFKGITDGQRIVQGVFQDGILKDCDYTDKKKMILEFVHEFSHPKYIFESESRGDVFEFYNEVRNVTSAVGESFALLVFRKTKSLQEFRDMVRLKRDIRNCHRLMRSIKKDKRKRSRMMRLYKNKDAPGKAYFDTTDSPGIYNSPNFNRLQTVNPEEISENVYNNHNPLILRKSGKILGNGNWPLHNRYKGHRRNKRSFINRWLMFPGTKWCGRGQLAKEYDELGEDVEADTCCREHDCCQEIIPCFTTRYNYFNYRFHALLHCQCDNRFRGCLKQSVSPMASLIGRIYFNIMGSKCFEYESKEICMRRSWWGTCQEYKNETTAVIKDQEPYTYCDDD